MCSKHIGCLFFTWDHAKMSNEVGKRILVAAQVPAKQHKTNVHKNGESGALRSSVRTECGRTRAGGEAERDARRRRRAAEIPARRLPTDGTDSGNSGTCGWG